MHLSEQILPINAKRRFFPFFNTIGKQRNPVPPKRYGIRF